MSKYQTQFALRRGLAMTRSIVLGGLAISALLIAAPLGVLRHPFHVAMFARGEEGAQPLARARDRIGPRDPGNFETMGARGGGERALERGRSQKSRLA